MEKTSATEKEKLCMRVRYARLRKAGLCPCCGKKAVKGKALCKTCNAKKVAWHERNRKRSNKLSADRRRRLWDQVLAGYGSRCNCCGETLVEFLTIDHIGGGGRKHRESLGNNIATLLLWIINEKFPKTIRILCMNCNLSYGMYGYCPHSKRKGKRHD